MRKVFVLILSLTFFMSVFLMGKTVQADMWEVSTGAYEYFEDIDIADVGYGFDVGSVISTDGRVFMWGANYYGDIGDGTKETRLLPIEITRNFNLQEEEQIVSIDFGESYTVALSSNGRVFTWGDNDSGTLGNGTFVEETMPVDITSNFDLAAEDEIVEIAIGSLQCSAISRLGEVFMWGDNGYGSINDSSEDYFELPTNITNTFGLNTDELIVKMSLGYAHTMALTSDGRVFTWGDNDEGALGNGTTARSSTPIDITAQFTLDTDETVIDIMAGNFVSLALTSSGNVLTWGSYYYGELGDNSVGDRLSPSDITSSFGFSENEHIIQVDYGEGFYIVLTNDNRVFGWGYNSDQQLGTPTNDTQLVPYDMTTYLGLEETEEVLDISAAAYNVAVLTSMNNLYTWGYNGGGQIGDGTTYDSTVPVNIKMKFNVTVVQQFSLGYDETVVDIAMGDFHYVMVTSYGRVLTWGYNSEGQLGDGTTISSEMPIDITDSLNLDVGEYPIAVECGEEHTVILTDNGTVYAWGDNEHGQLGDGTTITSHVPVELPASAFNSEQVVYISSHGDVAAAMTSSDTLYTWGFNPLGQMGDGTTVSKSIPTDVTGNFGLAIGETITDIEFGLYFSTALTSNGRYFTWGYNSTGQLGNGTTSITPIATPVEMDLAAFGGETIADISAGYAHTSVVTSSGKIYTWGLNNAGQLGDGTMTNSSTPTEIPASYFGGETIASVQLGFTYSTAITSSGNLYTWGGNSYSQLGVGDRNTRTTPVAVDTFFDVVNIVKLGTGKESVFAYSDTLELYQWGSDKNGPGGSISYDPYPISLLNMNSIERVYVPYTYEYYSDYIPISIFPTFDMGDQLYSITINGNEYLSDELTVSNGRIDLSINNEGMINERFNIVVESFSFVEGNQIDTNGMNDVSTMLYDLEAPTFSYLSLEEIDVGLSDIDWTERILFVNDNSDALVVLEEVEDTVLYDTLGTYTVTIKATDASMNETLNTFDVLVSDLSAPVITLNGGAMTIEVGNPYIELGATYTDNYDSPGDCIIGGDVVDTSTIGVYQVSYTITDSSGNEAIDIGRTVTVVDTTAPVITLNGDATVYIEIGDAYTELGATYIDNLDASGNAIISGDTVDTYTLGTYTVEYDMEDTNGNVSVTVLRTVIVQDTQAPVVSGVSDEEIFEKGTTITITFDDGTATLNGDKFDSGSKVDKAGDYTLVVTDASGNITTTNFTIEGGGSVLVYVLVIVGLVAIGAGAYIAKKLIFVN